MAAAAATAATNPKTLPAISRGTAAPVYVAGLTPLAVPVARAPAVCVAFAGTELMPSVLLASARRTISRWSADSEAKLTLMPASLHSVVNTALASIA